MTFDLWIPGRPHPKGRPRFTAGHAYTPKETKDAEKAIASAYVEAEGPSFDGPIAVYLDFYQDGINVEFWDYAPGGRAKCKLRGDLDNYVKTVLDGLQQTKRLDDRQVVYLRAEKH